MTPYTDFGGGRSPDYDDPRLIAALERFIAALGRRYDGNPRVAFVEMGLLGFWGEWHTYPRAELFASHQTQQRILEAAHRAFRQTLVMTRYADVYTGLAPWLGYFDDSFPADTDGPEAWKFLARMRRTERTGIWKRAPIGGEMMPPEAQKWLGAEFDRTMEMLQSAHFTWIGPYNPSLEATRDPQFRGRSEQMVRRMGYEFALTEIRSPESAARGGRLRVHVSGINQGVAPFYYPWPVELALLDLRANPVERFRLPVDIRTWLPGAFALSADPIVHAPPGRYRLALGIIDPWTRKPGIGFATALDRRNGWTVLTTIRITPRPALRRRRSPEA
jgi:hypothetical protein